MRVWIAVLVLSSCTGFAQATRPENPAPQQPAPAPNTPQTPTGQIQEPGAGAQIRTGSTVGDGVVQQMIARLDNLLADHQFLEMEHILADSDGADGGPGNKLTPQQSELFHGVLANRENRLEDSIRLLEPLARESKAAGTREQKTLLKALAEDYLRLGDWSKAQTTYRDLASASGEALSFDEKEELELPLQLLPLIAGYPRMTVEPGDAFSLPYDRDLLGLTDIPVFVDGISHDWMLDPTAPFNLICRSSAKEIGLKLSEASATVHTITGHEMEVHATLIPRFTLGTVTYRNMPAFVFDDEDYYFPATRYQVRGVLGYPAVSALGSLTVTADARIEVQPGAKGDRLTKGARFFLDGDRIVAALGKAGSERMFVLDAGGQQTYLSSRYYSEHSQDFKDQKMALLSLPGAEGKPPAPAYVADRVDLQVGPTPVNFQFVQVLTEPLGSAAVDDTYGTLGAQALDELKSYTFDYRTMRFAASPH